MNNFVVTAMGFVSSVSYEKVVNGPPKIEILYTNKLRESKPFSTKKHAEHFMQKYNLSGFVYNPWKEEPIRDMYTVKHSKKGFQWDDKSSIEHYYHEKVIMLSETDVNFLTTRKSASANLLTESEALNRAIELNKKAAGELISRAMELEILRDSK